MADFDDLTDGSLAVLTTALLLTATIALRILYITL
jgi:hypothetical protein